MPDRPASQIARFHLPAPPAQVLPLFTAEGERAWAPGWDPEILSGDERRGSAFSTRAPGRPETVWIVSDYRPEIGRVSYARVALGSNVGLVDVECLPAAGGGTEVSVRYTLTGLDADGRRFVEEFLSPAHYSAMIGEWQRLTGDALATRQDRPR